MVHRMQKGGFVRCGTRQIVTPFWLVENASDWLPAPASPLSCFMLQHIRQLCVADSHSAICQIPPTPD